MIDDILASVMGSPAVEWGSGARLTGREVISTSQTARRGLKRAQKAMKDPLEELQKPTKAKRVALPPSSPAFDFDASSSSSSSSSDEELEKLQQALKPTPTPAPTPEQKLEQKPAPTSKGTDEESWNESESGAGAWGQ